MLEVPNDKNAPWQMSVLALFRHAGMSSFLTLLEEEQTSRGRGESVEKPNSDIPRAANSGSHFRF
jgi:hypothetical protein